MEPNLSAPYDWGMRTRRGDITAAIRFEVRVEAFEQMVTRTTEPASDATRWVVAAEKFNMVLGDKS